MKNLIKNTNLLILIFTTILFVSCNKGSKNASLTGWNSKDMAAGGFSNSKKYKGQKTPSGMVLVEGGTFTMGHVQDDVMFDWNTTPVKMQIRTFYLDETEVTNSEYLFYLEWTKRVFPPSNENYQHIYASAVPDTLVWRNVLGSNELLTENYLRHPSYANYPVVGVSWVQANQYCKWRGDRVNEKKLMDKGILKSLFELDSLKVEGADHFSTQGYLANPYHMFNGDSTIYKKGLPTPNKKTVKRKKGQKRSKKGSKGSFSGRQVKISDGILASAYRLPTEVEWEYAAKALIENREYNNIRGRKKFPWDGAHTRNKSRKHRGDQLANFKQGQGDYSGVAGWTSDGAAITNAVKKYEPNAFGLYDMAGNVAEWVADVYRPIIDSEANDFNYYRGNIFAKTLIDEEGKAVFVDFDNMDFDTLDNGKISPTDLPGDIKYVPVTKSDAFMRNNYEKSFNVDVYDGDLESTRDYDYEDTDGVKPRMYNSPITPKELGEGDQIKQQYDAQVRTTMISDKTRVVKGGSWKDRAYWLDPAQRRYLQEYMGTNFIGFRCATDKLGAESKGKRKAHASKVK